MVPRLLAAVLLVHTARAFLLGIDFGAQFFKAAVVAPGKPFEVVHNQHSKRKTPTAVSFVEQVRSFGDDALAAAARGPAKVPMLFVMQLGRNFTGVDEKKLPWLPTDFYPYNLGVNASGSLSFNFPDGTSYTAEEVASHILNWIKSLAMHTVDGVSVSETIITIPSEASYSQRRALVGAARIAGLPRPQLVHETSAAALQRALDLDLSGENGTENMSRTLFYNMGARHTEVCIVEYTGATHMSKPTVAMRVLGCGSTSELGGHQVDLLIAAKMLEAFKAKHPKLASISSNIRALKKLEKEATSLKHVLSANKEGQFRVESLYEDTDFMAPVTRESAEEWCKELFSKFAVPIEVALGVANVTVADIDTVEMIGGGWRIPKIQSLLADYLQANRPAGAPALALSQHVNGDEAMATGAAFFGANSSISFRTKRIFYTDYTSHSYAVLLEPLDDSQPHEEGWQRGVELFADGTTLRSRKTAKLTVNFDLRLTLVEDGNRVAVWDVIGIHQAATMTYAHLPTPLVILKFELDSSGLVQLDSATAVFDEPVVANASAEAMLKNASEGDDAQPGEGAEANASAPQEPPEAEAEAGAAAEEAADANASASADTNATVAPTLPKIKKRKVPIVPIERFDVGISPRGLSPEEREFAMARLRTMEAKDAEVRAVEAAKNALESFVYDSREKLSGDENCLQVSTEEEREAIMENLTKAEAWLYEDEAAAATAEQFREQLKELQSQVGPILFRATELEQRASLPDLVETVKKYVASALAYVEKNMTWVDASQRQGVINMTTKFETWWENVTAVQKNRALTEMPLYQSVDVKKQLYLLQQESERLTKIRKIDPVPRYDDYYGKYGYGYGAYGPYGDMYRNYSGNNSNFSNFWRNYTRNNSGNDSYSGYDADYMKSFYEHMARNFSDSNTTGPGGAGGGDSSAEKAEL